MLLTTEVTIELKTRNYKLLKKIYELDDSQKVGDVVVIPISKLSLGSHYNVDVSCDYCNKKQKVEYRKYIKSISVCNKFCCSNIECSNQKIKDVCQVKYNVDNPFQSEEVKEKTKNTLMHKYGVEHQMHIESTKTKIKETSLEKYGVDNYTKTEEYKEKTKKTNLQKYGVEWSLQSEEVKEKGKKTSLEKYGVEFAAQSPIIREKTIQTCLKRWGYTSNSYSEVCKKKLRQTSLERYGVDNPMKSDLLRQKYKVGSDPYHIKYLNSGISLFKCDNKEEHEFEITTSLYLSRKVDLSTLCTICNPLNTRCSDREVKLYEYIKSIYAGEIVRNYRDGLEIDIFIPSLNLGIEFNGIYWHSDEYRDKHWHQKKTIHFESKGIRIIHIWEDDWLEKTEIIKSQIRNWLGISKNKIFARKCEVKPILDGRKVIESLQQWHIQGKDNSVIRLGLYFNDELVSVMTFDKFEGRKKLNEKSWNLSRFCTKLDSSVVGGASKLLKFFIKNYKPERIVSYADRCWSTGELYFKLGFEAISYSKPDYKYVVKSKRVHKSNFRKSKLKIDISESDFAKQKNIFKIWDCGKIKFEIKL